MSRPLKVAAGLIIAYLSVLSVFGPALAPYDPDHSVTVLMYEGEKLISPFGPNDVHWLGTDIWGYDMLTRILYGFRYTVGAVLACAGLRVLIAFLIGTVSAVRSHRITSSSGTLSGGRFRRLSIGRPLRRLTGRLSVPTIPFVVPAFIIVYFTAFRLSIGTSMPIWRLVVFQGALIVLVGLPGLIGSFRADGTNLLQAEFCTAAIAAGAGKGRLIRRHMLPHMVGTTVMRFMSEAVSVLALLGQLAMFNIFFGGTRVTFDPILYHSRTNELAGMVGEYRMYLTSRQWLLLSPLAAYLSVLLGFFLLSRIVRRLNTVRRGKYV